MKPQLLGYSCCALRRLNAGTEQLTNLPRRFSSSMMLRDEGEVYGRKSAPAGVTVISVRYNAATHDFTLRFH